MINFVNAYHVHELLSPDNPVKYHVPAYQREYSWSKAHWELFKDLSESEGQHFLGSIICMNQTRDAMEGSALENIDGQQRMTTLSLLLAAIYHELADNRDLLDDDQTFGILNLRKSIALGGKDGQPRVRPNDRTPTRTTVSSRSRTPDFPSPVAVVGTWECDGWDEDCIDKRTSQMIERLLKVWPVPAKMKAWSGTNTQ